MKENILEKINRIYYAGKTPSLSRFRKLCKKYGLKNRLLEVLK